MSGSAVARRALIIFTMLSALCASAQERGFAAHRYEGSTAGSWLFMVDRPWYSSTRFFALGVTADGALNPLVPALSTGRGAASPVISVALLGHVDVAGSFLDRILLRASLPITLLERGTQESVSGAQPLRNVALGDPRAGLMIRLFGQPERDGFSLHLGGDVWFPVGAAATNEGDRTMRFLPRLVMAGAAGKARWTIDAGFLFRSYASIGPPALGMTASSEARLGAAFGFALLDDRLYLGPEVKFSTQVFGANAFALNGMSLEVLGGAQVLIAEHLQLGIAAGAGFFGAAGTPDARALVRLAWAPRRAQASPLELQAQADLVDAGALPTGDADFDGVPNDPDRCPYEAENWNGVRDDDGCPEYMLASDSPLAKVLISETPARFRDAGSVGVLTADAGALVQAQKQRDATPTDDGALVAGARANDAGTRAVDAGTARRDATPTDDGALVVGARANDAGTRAVDAGTTRRDATPTDDGALVAGARASDAGTTRRDDAMRSDGGALVTGARAYDAGTRSVDAGSMRRDDGALVAGARAYDAGTRAVDAGSVRRDPTRTFVDDDDVVLVAGAVDAGSSRRDATRVDDGAAPVAGARAYDAGSSRRDATRTFVDDDDVALVAGVRAVDAGSTPRDVASADDVLLVAGARTFDAGARTFDAGSTQRDATRVDDGPALIAGARTSDAGVARRDATRADGAMVGGARTSDAGSVRTDDGAMLVTSAHTSDAGIATQTDGVTPVAAARAGDAGARVTTSNALDLIGSGVLVATTLDSDGDGLVDEADRCPVQPEDLDGFEDEDGCSELDNDRDSILDVNDRCPLEAETPNGIEDEDGCPDVAPDADNDWLADSADRCPYEPETYDGIRDDDGCPEFQGPTREALSLLITPPVVTPQSAPTQKEVAQALDYGLGDADKDGVIDDADRCPVTPEDRDGFEDEDGCPEDDNDDDGIIDANDTCPVEAETFNAWADEDGCPDAHQDLDADGLLYDADRCPFEPSATADGCPHVELPKLAIAGFPGAPATPGQTPAAVESAPPVADFDRDGVDDEADRCPVSAEDVDGFEDEDGCPEPDNDADGIADAKDKCPFEAETINGVKDDDGCPDKGASKVSIEGERVVVKGVILFTTGSAKLTPSSLPLLKQVAATLKAASSISVEIQGHTDDVGNAAKNIKLSKQRAEAIRKVLIKAGVAENRLVANGYGPTRPVASNTTAKGREKNRRVEFLILGESQ